MIIADTITASASIAYPADLPPALYASPQALRPSPHALRAVGTRRGRCARGGVWLALAGSGALLGATGCTVGPDYQQPVVAVPGGYASVDGKRRDDDPARTATQPSQTTDRPVQITQWWALFGDPQLDELVQMAVEGNIDLRRAQSRVRQARAQRSGTAAGFFPRVDSSGGYQRARGSGNIQIPAGAFGGGAGASGSAGGGGAGGSGNTGQSSGGLSAAAAGDGGGSNGVGSNGGGSSGGNSSGNGSNGGGSSPGQSGTTGQPVGGNNPGPGGASSAPLSPIGLGGLPGVGTDLYQVGFDASWEIDVFGGTRRSVEAADAETAAALEDHRFVLLSLLAEVADAYISLRGLQQRVDLATRTLTAQRETLKLIQDRFNAGLSTNLDISRQRALVATTLADIPPLAAQVRVQVNRLAILLGREPGFLSQQLLQPGKLPPVPPEVPVGVPSDLLRRRPDIRRAERRLAAATARIGMATADLFPKFSLTGTFGLDASNFSDLAEWNSRYFSIGPGISWNVFDGGRIRANIAVQNELTEQALLDYRLTILQSIQEVEDGLTRYRTEQSRRAALAEAVAANEASVRLARDEYTQGLTDLLTILDAQRQLFSSQDQLAQSQQLVTTNLISLYKSIGGGWEAQLPANNPAPAIP